MKRTTIALSAILLASPAFATTMTHATDKAVAAAHEGANTAKEKLHDAQNTGKELRLQSRHAAEGKSDTLSSHISEGSQKAWHKTQEGTEKGWDATKESAEKGWHNTKKGTEKGWNATKAGTEKGWDATKEATSDLKKKITE